MGTRDLNKIMLTGKVEAEPEMRFTAEGEPRTTFFLISASAGAGDSTAAERFRLVAWGEPLAERCNDLLQGATLLVEGSLQRCAADDEAERARFPFEVRVRSYLVLDAGGTAAMPVPTSPRPPAPPARLATPPPISRPPASPPLVRAPLPVMPARPTAPRPPAPTRRSTPTTVAPARRSSEPAE